MLLIIIEAPKKIDTVRHAARAVWGKDIDVFATGGYVKTFPDDSIGIDPHSFEPNSDIYTKHGTYFRDSLSRAYATYGTDGPWECVYLLTDPDREGEGIAVQALTELRRWFPRVPVTRVYAHELTSEGLLHAEKRPDIHAGMVSAQKARRVLDRLLPLSASSHLGRGGDYRGLGRLQLAAVKVVKAASSTWKRFSLEGRWSTPDGPYHVEHQNTSEEHLRLSLAAMRASDVWDKSSKSVTVETISPPTPHSAFTLMTAISDERPEDTMAAAQLSYSLGRMSYPRTDQTALGIHGRRTVAAVIDELHLGSRLQAEWHVMAQPTLAESWVQGAHPGLHPLHTWNPEVRLNDPLVTKVENEISARAMASLMKPAVIKVSRVFVNSVHDTLVATKTEVIEPGWTLAYTRLGLDNPLVPTMPFGQRLPRIYEKMPTPAHVVDWMYRANLGRPSTLAHVPTRLQQLGLLSAICIPTTIAEKTAAAVGRTMPRLIEPEFTTLMEQGLAHLLDNPSDYHSVVKNLLVEAGTDLIGLPGLISNPEGLDVLSEPESFGDNGLF